ncbi:MAG: GNAT family N-acetyltransferase [Proteobacteria bacterium]|nr:GNAT family N-acetyltransferase [Pseudomonadota bacterium]
MSIREDDLRGSAVLNLLSEHLQDALKYSPPESVHALDALALRSPEITFWTAWRGGELLGCGALKELDRRHGEIKSMRTARTHQRKGVGSTILQYIINEAKHRSYTRLSLETGSMDAFAPARALYARFGFEFCDPFADYQRDPNSVFMTMKL